LKDEKSVSADCDLSKQCNHLTAFVGTSVLNYDMLNLEVPTLPVVGSLIKAGVRVLIYR